jgi:hypothetical protein
MLDKGGQLWLVVPGFQNPFHKDSTVSTAKYQSNCYVLRKNAVLAPERG